MRRDILRLLRDAPRPVGDIASELPISRPAVSKHLRVLQAAGLVTCEASGTRNLYRVSPRGFDAARAFLDDFWDDALARFKLAAENTTPPRKRGRRG